MTHGARMLSIPKPPPDRGRLLTAEDVQQLVGGNPPPTLDWIRAHVPHKLKLSHRCVRWYEDDILTWLEGLREAS